MFTNIGKNLLGKILGDFLQTHRVALIQISADYDFEPYRLDGWMMHLQMKERISD
jgi:hypothetical protein